MRRESALFCYYMLNALANNEQATIAAENARIEMQNRLQEAQTINQQAAQQPATPQAGQATTVNEGHENWTVIQQPVIPQAGEGTTVNEGHENWTVIQQSATPQAGQGTTVNEGHENWTVIQQPTIPQAGEGTTANEGHETSTAIQEIPDAPDEEPGSGTESAAADVTLEGFRKWLEAGGVDDAFDNTTLLNLLDDIEATGADYSYQLGEVREYLMEELSSAFADEGLDTTLPLDEEGVRLRETPGAEPPDAEAGTHPVEADVAPPPDAPPPEEGPPEVPAEPEPS